jgi:hypothetical protein
VTPPFSSEQFFAVFASYNVAVWPLQVVFNLVAISLVAVALLRWRRAGTIVPLGLAVFWIWMGLAYHWIYFADINPAARLFAVAFVAEGGLLALWGLKGPSPRFGPARDAFGITGGVLIAYALAIYPVLGIALGHTYPAQPTFGLPCPTTIFTIGLLLWAEPKVPWWLLIIPALWSVVGTTAVRYFGVLEDAVLPVAAWLGSAMILLENRRARTTSARHKQP